LLRRGLLLAAAVSLAVLAAGCGGGAKTGGSTTTTSSPSRGFDLKPEDVAETILSAAASAAIDQAMTALGLPTSSNELKAIQERLDKIDQRLAEIQTFLKNQTLKGDCDAARRNAADIISLIVDGESKLMEASQPTDEAKRKTRLATLDTYIYNNLDSKQQRLNDILIGKNEPSLITDCGKYLDSQDQPNLWTRDDSKKLFDFMASYGYYESILQGLRKGYRLRNDYTADEISKFENAFKAQIAEQDKLVKPVIPVDTFLDRRPNGLLWRMKAANQMTVAQVKSGSYPPWATKARSDGWALSGIKNDAPTCNQLRELQLLASAGYRKFADWLRQRGMISGTGTYADQVICFNSTAPGPFYGLRMYNGSAVSTVALLLGVPADSASVNIVQAYKPKDLDYTYYKP
jgi:hypothetical protein